MASATPSDQYEPPGHSGVKVQEWTSDTVRARSLHREWC